MVMNEYAARDENLKFQIRLVRILQYSVSSGYVQAQAHAPEICDFGEIGENAERCEQHNCLCDVLQYAALTILL